MEFLPDRLTKKQLVWVSVRGRASALAWKDCEELLGESTLNKTHKKKLSIHSASFIPMIYVLL